MPKSFIKIQPVKSSSEKHNTREIEPKYLIESSNKNLCIVDEKIADRFEKVKANYEKNVGQKMQKKATPIREAVILLPDDKNEINSQLLFKLSDELEQKYGIKTFQWHIHNDEGHKNDKGELKYNYHAHLVFDWTDEKGKSLKLDKNDMSEIQTLTAEVMQMERGEFQSKSLSLNHKEYRGFMEVKDKLERELKQELTKKQEKEIRQEFVQKREELKAIKNENKERNRGGITRR